MKEYAFDIKMAVVARVQAEDEDKARALLETLLSGINVDYRVRSYGAYKGEIQLTEASLDDCDPHLFEVDGKEVER